MKLFHSVIFPEEVTKKWVNAINASEFINVGGDAVTIESQMKYVETILDDPTRVLYGLFDDENIVATCGVQGLNTHRPTAGFLVFPKNRRQGIGARILRETAEKLNLEYGTTTLYGGTQVGNIPGLLTALSAGAIVKRKGDIWEWEIRT